MRRSGDLKGLSEGLLVLGLVRKSKWRSELSFFGSSVSSKGFLGHFARVTLWVEAMQASTYRTTVGLGLALHLGIYSLFHFNQFFGVSSQYSETWNVLPRRLRNLLLLPFLWLVFFKRLVEALSADLWTTFGFNNPWKKQVVDF